MNNRLFGVFGACLLAIVALSVIKIVALNAFPNRGTSTPDPITTITHCTYNSHNPKLFHVVYTSCGTFINQTEIQMDPGSVYTFSIQDGSIVGIKEER